MLKSIASNAKSFFIALFAIALFATPASALTFKGSTEPLTPEETEAVLPFYEVSYEWCKDDNSNVAIVAPSNGNDLPDGTYLKRISSLRKFIFIVIDGRRTILILEKDNNTPWMEIQSRFESFNAKAKGEMK